MIHRGFGCQSSLAGDAQKDKVCRDKGEWPQWAGNPAKEEGAGQLDGIIVSQRMG